MKYFLIILGALVIIGGGVFLFQDADTDTQDAPQNNNEEASEGESEESSEEETLNEEEVLSLLGNIKSIESLKYDVTIDSDSEVVSGTFWQKGENIRMEGEMDGQKMVSIVDNEEKFAYIYVPSQGLATKVSLGEVQEAQNASMKGQSEDILEHDLVLVGEEVIDGRECVIVEYTDKNTITKTWIWKEKGLPVKVEIKGENGLTVVKAENIETGSVSDDVFELPEDVEITEIPVL